MTGLISDIFGRVKKIGVVQNSLNAAQIAVETFQMVKKDFEQPSDKPSSLIEDIYLNASQKVTGQDEEHVKDSIDYKAVAFLGKTGRKARKIAYSGYDRAKASANKVKSLVNPLECAPIKAGMNVVNAVGCAVNKVRHCVTIIAKIVKEATTNLISHAKHFVSEKYEKLTDLLLSFDFVKSAKDKLENLRDSLKSRTNFATETCAKNFESAVEQKDIAKQTFLNFFRNNYNLFMLSFRSNRDLLVNFLKNYDLELFYGPDKSVKVFKPVKNLIWKSEAEEHTTENTESSGESSRHRKRKNKH